MRIIPRFLWLIFLIFILIIGYLWIPEYVDNKGFLQLWAFIFGILSSIAVMQIIYAFPNFRAFKNQQTEHSINPFLAFASRILIGLAGIAVITILSIHYLLRKPVINFTDGKPAMALKKNIKEITTHRNTKFEVHVQFATTNFDTIDTYDMLFREELKYIIDEDSLPIVYSASNPKKIAIITTNDKLERIKKGK